MIPRYVDIHCHPYMGALKAEQDVVIQNMASGEVVGLVVGVDEQTSREAIALAEKYEHLYATVGLHPNDTPHEIFDPSIYGSMAAHAKVVAIGECGIDYFRIKGDPDIEKKHQWEIFDKHVELALAVDKPLMIHCRSSKGSMDAYEEMLTFLSTKIEAPNSKLRGNLHFFVGDIAIAKKFWSIGFTTSFTGVLTFTHDYDEVVRAAPLDMIMTETDAPFAAPAPHRGKTNYPTYVPLVVDAIATIRGEPVEVIREAMVQNATRVFGLRT